MHTPKMGPACCLDYLCYKENKQSKRGKLKMLSRFTLFSMAILIIRVLILDCQKCQICQFLGCFRMTIQLTGMNTWLKSEGAQSVQVTLSLCKYPAVISVTRSPIESFLEEPNTDDWFSEWIHLSSKVTSWTPVFQTAYMPNRHRLFCFLPNFKIKNSSETVIRLLRRLGYLKRRIQIFSFMKKKKCSFSLFFTPLFLGFFHIYIWNHPFFLFEITLYPPNMS